MTVIEFHTVRRPDLVPPRPAVTFPATAEPVAVADGRALVVQLDPPGGESSRMIRGDTCTLAWRRIHPGAAPIELAAAATEVFVYVVRGAADLGGADGRQRVNPGTLIVSPARQRVTMQAGTTTEVSLVEFSPERH